MYKRDYVFRMNVIEEIFEIKSCLEILANDKKIDTYVLQLIKNCKIYILWDLSSSFKRYD